MIGPIRSEGYLIWEAGGAIGAYLIAKRSAEDTLVIAAAATDELIGPVQNSDGVSTTLNATSVQICMVGQVGKVKIGAAVTQGKWLTTDAAGKAIESTGPTDRLIGRAMSTGTADGQVITYEHIPHGTRS